MFLWYSSLSLCGGRFGSFGFAKRWLVCRAKPNVPNVRLAKIELKKMCGGENKKYRRVGNECRLTRCSFEIWSVCWSPVKMVCFCINVQFLVVCLWLHCRLLGLLITFSGLAMVAIFTTNVDAENQTLINHKCVWRAPNRHFCQTRVVCSLF